MVARRRCFAVQRQPCDICGSPDPKVVFEHKHLDGPLVRCQRCGLYYVDIGFALAILEKFPDAPEKVAPEYWKLLGQGMRVCAELEAAEDDVKKAYFSDRVRLLEELCDRGARVLDVGCSRGVFLELAKDAGFEPFGVELGVDEAEAAGSKVGGEIVVGDFEEVEIPYRDFDVVTLFHVIEHFKSPSLGVAKVRSLLKPGGLVIIETPRIDNLWFRLLGRRWRQFILGHFFFFSMKTLGDLLERHGFSIIETRTPTKTVTARFLLNRVERHWLLPAKALAWVAQALRLADVRIRLRLSDTMLVCAKKMDDTTVSGRM